MLMNPGSYTSIGHRHGLLGVRPSGAFERFRSYQTGYTLGRLQAVVQTVAGITGIAFSLGVMVYTMFW